MSITASGLVAVETAAGKGDLWLPPALFLHDWGAALSGIGTGGGLVLRTSWPTNVAAMNSAGEVRSGLSPKPSRSLDAVFTAMCQSEAALLRSVLQRMTMARTPVPLFCDTTPLTSPATAGDMYLLCMTTQRRFFVGGLVAIWTAESRNVALSGDFELGVITSVWDAGILLSVGVSRDYAAGAQAAPVMEADLVVQTPADYVTDAILRVAVTFRETVGAMTLPGLVDPSSLPTGINSYNGLPVLDLPADWSGALGGGGNESGAASGNQGGAFRSNETTQIGLVNYTEVHGSRFKATQAMNALGLDRGSAWLLAAFFDCRAGRQKPFLAVDLTADFALTGTLPAEGDTVIHLAGTAPMLDWSWRTHLALMLADGTVIVRQISGTPTRATGIDTVALDAALGALGGGVVRVASAFIARFDTDELVENWITDQMLGVQLPAIEALNETDVFLSNMPGTRPGGGGRRPMPAGTGIMDYGLITPDIFSGTVSYWAAGANLPAGTYRVSYVTGAMSYVGGGNLWGVHYNGGPGETWGYQGTQFPAPGIVGPLPTEAQVLSASYGMNVIFTLFYPQPIGIYLHDNLYSDNQAATFGAPTWRLERLS